MNTFSSIDMELLNTVADIETIPQGAINIRKDGQAVLRRSSPNIILSSLEDKPGLKVEIKAGTKGESVHVPVILTAEGLNDKVYNTFIVGEDAEATIVAGCGIHCDSHQDSSHIGIHEIIVRKGAYLKYVEKHVGEGEGRGKRVFHPTTIIHVEEGATAELDMTQIRGVDDTFRVTNADIGTKGKLKIYERVLTHNDQTAKSEINVSINGAGGSAQILSRSVAQDKSKQVFMAKMIGRNDCLGHVECDAIIMGDSVIHAIPELSAESSEAILTHEASIGRIAGEQIIKLMSLGLTEDEAIDTIINGFLK